MIKTPLSKEVENKEQSTVKEESERKEETLTAIMVGQWTATTKPSRSDEVLDEHQQLQISNQIRAQFDSMVPKRPTKPSRSEPDGTAPPALVNIGDEKDIPELGKLRSIQSQSSVVFSDNVVVQDEFVETQYYKELDSIDKQHHTTGSGFIRVVKALEDENGPFDIPLRRGGGDAGIVSAYRGNPATNDWVPSLEDSQVYVSSKPNRSESC